jgi:hypothetical protein
MQLGSEKDELRSRNAFIIIFYFSATVMLSICFFGLYVSVVEYLKTGRIVIGEVLVNTEFPFHHHVKLVTYVMIASVLSWFCVGRTHTKNNNPLHCLRPKLMPNVCIEGFRNTEQRFYSWIS